MTFKNITVQVDSETYTEVKKIALEENTTVKQLVNEYLAEGVRAKKGQTKLD